MKCIPIREGFTEAERQPLHEIGAAVKRYVSKEYLAGIKPDQLALIYPAKNSITGWARSMGP